MSLTQSQRLNVTVVTDASGNATAYSDIISGPIRTIIYTKAASGSYTDGVGVTMTLEATGQSVWAEAAVNASAVRSPSQPVHTQAGVAVGATNVEEIVAGFDRIKIVLASGGAAKTGLFQFIVG